MDNKIQYNLIKVLNNSQIIFRSLVVSSYEQAIHITHECFFLISFGGLNTFLETFFLEA